MKEVTRIITAQITLIEQVTDEDADTIVASQEEAKANVVDALSVLYNPDDINVEIQDFEMDK